MGGRRPGGCGRQWVAVGGGAAAGGGGRWGRWGRWGAVGGGGRWAVVGGLFLSTFLASQPVRLKTYTSKANQKKASDLSSGIGSPPVKNY